jgi:hypothetical protein
MTVTDFGFQPASRTVQVPADGTATVDVVLVAAPRAVLSGTVASSFGPLPGATVTVVGTPLSTRTDAAGGYRLVVPVGSYDVRAEPVGGCVSAGTAHVDLTGDRVLPLVLATRADRFGDTCGPTAGEYVAGTDALALTGDENSAEISLPFPVRFYGRTYTRASVSTNGFVTFGEPSSAFYNTAIPNPAEPNAALYPFFDDLVVDGPGAMYVAASSDAYVVEWRDVRLYGDTRQRLSFSVAIGRDGTVTYRYRGVVGGDLAHGASATVGVENADGTDGLAYSFNSATISDGLVVTFRPPAGGGHYAYERIRAADFDAQAGTQVEPCLDEGGGQDVGYIANGDWVRYTAVDFGSTPARQFLARVASGADGSIGGIIQVRLDRLDSVPVGDFAVSNTGGWQAWRTVPANLTGVTGPHTVYLTFTSAQPQEFVNLNWFTFRP